MGASLPAHVSRRHVHSRVAGCAALAAACGANGRGAAASFLLSECANLSSGLLPEVPLLQRLSANFASGLRKSNAFDESIRRHTKIIVGKKLGGCMIHAPDNGGDADEMIDARDSLFPSRSCGRTLITTEPQNRISCAAWRSLTLLHNRT